MPTSPELTATQGHSGEWTQRLRSIFRTGLSEDPSRDVPRSVTIDSFKAEDIPTFILFARNFQAELASQEDPCIEYQDLCFHLDRILAVTVEVQKRTLGAHGRGVKASIHNALTYAIASCAVLLEKHVPQIPAYRAMGSGSTSTVAAVKRDEMKFLNEQLKAQTEVMKTYLAFLVPGSGLDISTSDIDYEPISFDVDFKAEPIGRGIEGTTVHKGDFQGRPVAVKRLFRSFATTARQQVQLLTKADNHPNILRYFHLESCDTFLYVVLELCPASLQDIILYPAQHPDIAASFNEKRAMREIVAGLDYLHVLGIIHYNLKPTNVLVSQKKWGIGGSAAHRMLISDFGFWRKSLHDDDDASSNTVSGASGWCAPEVIRGEVQYHGTAEDAPNPDVPQTFAITEDLPSASIPSTADLPNKPLDIFSLGCLMYYVLTRGGHPFGKFSFEWDNNILAGSYSVNGLAESDKDYWEMTDLIRWALHQEASQRPSTLQCFQHPYFWDDLYRLNFLELASDRLDNISDPTATALVNIERNAVTIIGEDWRSRVDNRFLGNLEKAGNQLYGGSIRDLLRAIRRGGYEWSVLPKEIRTSEGKSPIDYLIFFASRFPRLLTHVHEVILKSDLAEDGAFKSFFREMNKRDTAAMNDGFW